jgi:type III secretion protein V
MSSPTNFPAFPSVLLLATVYRLALSIAATRMILSSGHAGRIIDTFGHLAAGGNLVIGLVVFAVITIVQFIVIAKGAERVGEVTARFSLDAMPGKQMSIDSDLRSGLIDKDEARRRRRMLELESKLHGSLDGAMKFIKGDAIAGIVILLVNLVGGLAVGVLQRQLSLEEALQTYSVLTIGDGMVTQVPALLLALSAGLVVTRTTIEGDDRHLGESIRGQLLQRPRVPLAAGILCCTLAFVPGFPSAMFLLLGVAGVITGVMLEPALRDRVLAAARARGLVMSPPVAGGLVLPPPASAPEPLRLRLGDGVRSLGSQRIEAILLTLLAEFEGRLGIVLPPITYGFDAVEAELTWRLIAYDVVIGRGVLASPNDEPELDRVLRECLRRNISTFLGAQEVSVMVARTAQTHPEVAKEAMRVLPPTRIAEVLRLLAEEEVPLRNLHLILEALAEAGQKEKDTPNLIVAARQTIHRQILSAYAPHGSLRALALSQGLERQLREAVRPNTGSPQLGLAPRTAQALIAQLKAEAEAVGAVAVAAPMDLRRALRKLIEPELFDLPVLAYSELKPPLKLDIVGWIGPIETDIGAAA